MKNKLQVFRSKVFNDWFNDYVLHVYYEEFIVACIHNSYNTIDKKIELFEELQLPIGNIYIDLYKEALETINTCRVFSVFDYMYNDITSEDIMKPICVSYYDSFDEVMKELYDDNKYYSHKIDLVADANKILDKTTLHMGYVDNKIEIFKIHMNKMDEYARDGKYININDIWEYPLKTNDMVKIQLPIMEKPIYGTYVEDTFIRLDSGQELWVYFMDFYYNNSYSTLDWIDKV